MTNVADLLRDAIGVRNVLVGELASADYSHDESLTAEPQTPALIVRPETAEHVAEILRIAAEQEIPVTARGMGTGISGAAVPQPDGILVSFERMNKILSIDTANHVAVVQPGVTLRELDERTAADGLVYPVYPGEMSASIGGNVATNAGGMRAVRYGVTRENVLGLEAVLPTGEIIRSGGAIVKTSSGYDLTQLIIGSEGTLALVTEVTLKLQPRAAVQATMLAPFDDLDAVTAAVPHLIGSGLAPTLLEYVDALTMAAITYTSELELGIPDDVRDSAQAYLVITLENRDGARSEADVLDAGQLLEKLGAVDVYLLPAAAATALVEAREKAFWTGKTAGAAEVIDIVVPRAAMPRFMARARELAAKHESMVVGCGHAGDGNVHLAIFQEDPDRRFELLHEMFATGMELGGVISAEHGIGRDKKRHFNELEDPAKIDLMRRIKHAFDPGGILNPGVVFDIEDVTVSAEPTL